MNKCAVFGCKRGYESEEPQHEDYHVFYFPLDERKSHLLPAWEKYQEDEINAFLSQDIIGDFSELNSTHAPPGFQCTKSDNSIVFFNLTYVDGFPVIFESIKVDQSLHFQLQFNGHPVPLPAWFTKGRNATLTRFSQAKQLSKRNPNCV